MDLGSENEAQAQLDSQQLQKGPRLSRNDAKWDSLKDAIHQIYMIENKTLPATMRLIEERHGFKASERKWKTKLKGWKFEKYLSDQDKRIIVAKAEKRARDGKDTVFYHGDTEITTEKIENFKRRKVSKTEVAFPSAETPEYISYNTPKEENNTSARAYDVQRIIHEVDSLGFATETETAHPETPKSERIHPVLDEAFLNVANMGVRYSFPTFTRKDILDITIKSDRAAAAMAQAVEADYPGNRSLAITAYLDAIEQITQIEGHASPVTSETLEAIAQEFISLHNEDRSQDESKAKLTAAALRRLGGVALDKGDSSEDRSEVRTTTTRSYKYGVTYSESGITGVSLSEFFVP